MSILTNLLKDIARQGTILESELGDDPPHLFDPKPWKSYDIDLPSPKAWKASQSIIANCAELISLLTPTKIKLLTEGTINYVTVGMGVACDLRIADKIIENGGEATLEYLAKVCDVDEHKLGCTLHMLCNRHVFVEIAPNVFRNNRHSYELRKETGAADMVLIDTEEAYKCGEAWLDTMKDPATKHEIDPAKGAFSKAYKTETGVLPWLGTPEGANLLRKFGTGVPWLSGITVVATINDIPWDAYGSTVCDVGCGPGGVILEVKKKYPKLNVICQDLEPMMGMVNDLFKKEIPGSLDSGGVKVEVHDYFTPQTTAADVYWMRGVIRDYPDKEAQKILENLRHALVKNPKAKILVNELIIPSFITPASNPTAPASECLPASQSGYPETCHMMQLNTMALMGGKERTFHDIVKIGQAAGLKVSKFHQLRMFTGTIEFELA